MGRVRFAGACVAGALVLCSTGSASAAKVLDLSTTEGLIAPGTQLNLGGSTFETPLGSIDCPGGIIVATLVNNSSSKDRVSIDTAAPTGKNGVVCSTSSPLGSVEVQATGLPWTQQFGSNGKALLKGHGKLAIAVTVPLFGVHCSYEARKIKETFPLAANGVPAPLELSTGSQTFVRSASSATLCPSPIEIDLAGVPLSIQDPSGNPTPVYVTRRVV